MSRIQHPLAPGTLVTFRMRNSGIPELGIEDFHVKGVVWDYRIPNDVPATEFWNEFESKCLYVIRSGSEFWDVIPELVTVG